MPELTREEKLKLVEKLPQQLQDLLYSEDTGAFLLYLGQKYNLPDEKVRLLSKLVADVVLGIVPITSLAQEINSKIISDAQAAMNLAQELNTELLAPVMAPMVTPFQPVAPPTTTIPTKPLDEYREPTVNTPEVVDLRKTPLPILSPKPSEQFRSNDRESSIKSGQNRGSSISQPRQGGGEIGTMPVAPKPIPSIPAPMPTTPLKPLTSPLTFARPIQPLIEAEPHKIPPAPKPIIPTPKPIDTYRESTEPRPQYIMRPSGAPPTDLPDNVLDLRKDKGEF